MKQHNIKRRQNNKSKEHVKIFPTQQRSKQLTSVPLITSLPSEPQSKPQCCKNPLYNENAAVMWLILANQSSNVEPARVVAGFWRPEPQNHVPTTSDTTDTTFSQPLPVQRGDAKWRHVNVGEEANMHRPIQVDTSLRCGLNEQTKKMGKDTHKTREKGKTPHFTRTIHKLQGLCVSGIQSGCLEKTKKRGE